MTGPPGQYVPDPENQQVAYDFPIRPGRLARLVLPMDLTVAEAERLGEFVRSLAFPDQEADRG